MDTVAIVKNRGDITSAVASAIELMGGIDKYIQKKDKVLIKPNLCIDKPYISGATTNPAVVEALVKLAWKAGARDVIIADGTTVGLSTSKVFEVTGYYELARRCGARLVDLNEDEMVRVDIRDGLSLRNIHVSREVLTSDCLINVPMLKTHIHTTVTVSMKNMKGVIAPRTKRKTHLVGLEGGIVDINHYVRASLILVDGIIGQEGLGPQSGDPIRMDLIIAGDTPASTDAVCSRIMGFNPFDIKYITMASARGLGEIDKNKIKILGERVATVARNFRSPVKALNGGKYPGVNIKSIDACSDCVGGVLMALKRLEEDGTLDLVRKKFGQMNIYMGKSRINFNGGHDENQHALCILSGKCQRQFKNGLQYIPGCPPPGFLIRDIVREKVGLPPLYHPEDFVQQEEHILKVEKEEAARLKRKSPSVR